jgi:hypothetical protein
MSIGNRRGIERAHHARKRLSAWEQEPMIRELDEIMRAATPQPMT